MFNEKEYDKRYYQEHKDKYRINNRKWAKENPEANRIIKQKSSKKWREKNPEKIKEKQKRYRELHKKELSISSKTYSQTLRGKFICLKKNTHTRNRKLELSFEDFCRIVAKPCVYCGETEKKRGIDRVDSKKEYVLDNSVSCCEGCNRAKWTFSQKDFLSHIDEIYNYQHRNAGKE